ncbi:uncharacterized protein FOMMEDRAFT_83912 [Fomitiporia mediterranea MF3/22]|uniref:uncharacterized protein n=1 Tax=Fomitiporia mediterranea (strain MF3/22) TaxID=694068 RepID=UPI00044098DD|nr:uncharacterized protein FOMMEDRAFT_83912 [Fomitiporia mediterranea MF3/22]EJD03718.1 hypothetical protein FOMMEDRAFT_83912 [Fomitiporia mediterranea MF3/22]
MASQLAPLSASVTRILSLTGFSKELKTKDIQAAFSDWESASGGFRIKWIDDTSLMIVFNDAGVAKRAYLRALCMPPSAIFEGSSVASIRPYDGPDAQVIIQNVNARHASNASRSHNSRGSVSVSNGHGRMASTSVRNGGPMKLANGTIPEHPNVSINTNGNGVLSGREPSPTLPSVPSHPTLSSMISSSSPFAEDAIMNDPAILAAGEQNPGAAPPRIGDPGKRMLGAALGVRHPGLGPRTLSGSNSGGSDQGMLKDVSKAMAGLTVAE